MHCFTCKKETNVFVKHAFNTHKPEGGWIKQTRLICKSTCQRKCKYCDKCGLSNTITMHEKTKHPENFDNPFPYSCKKCNKHFAHSTQLDQHITIYHIKPSFPCEQCDLICKTTYCLSQHKLGHQITRPYLKISDKIYQCFNCSSTHTSIYLVAKCYNP